MGETILDQARLFCLPPTGYFFNEACAIVNLTGHHEEEIRNFLNFGGRECGEKKKKNEKGNNNNWVLSACL